MKKILLFFLCYSSIINVMGQSSGPNANHIEFDIKKTLPTSPEAAMLGKFGDVPIGYYTGTANVSIPLYTIKAGNFSIPITLNYHNSGIKVEDEATWVGLGWSLDPEGAIIKIFNGKDDAGDGLLGIDIEDYNFLFGRSITGVYSQTTDVGTSTWECSGQGTGSNGPKIDSAPILGSIALGNGQPDIYQFNMPGGYSGKFYINPKTQLPVLIDKKDSLVIRPSAGGWSIKTITGDQFIFTTQEVAYTDNFSDYSGFTWKLTKILLKNGKTVDYTYTAGGYAGLNYFETYHDSYPYQPIDPSDYGVIPHAFSPQSITQILTQIKTDNVIVNFNLEDRQDLKAVENSGGDRYTPKRLKSVDIVNTSSGQVTKSFNFSYSYFNSSNDPSYTFYSNSTNPLLPVHLTSRLKLDSLVEVGDTSIGAAVSNPAYVFTYNTAVSLPSKASFSRDFWGYNNGAANKLLLPNLYYFYYSDFENYKNVPAATLNAFNGANRTVDKDKMMAGMLTSIKYPTGGYTTFKYESNDFSNYSYPDIKGLASNIASVNVVDQNNLNNVKSASFTLTADQTVQFTNYIQSGPPNTANTFDGLLNSTIKLSTTINGITTLIRQWQMSTDQRQQFANNGNLMAWINEPIALKANLPYTISVELPDALGAQNSAMTQASVSSIFNYLSPAINVPKISFGGGARVSEITNYDITGSIIHKKTLKYTNEDGTSSGKLMSHLQFLYSKNLLCTSQRGNPNINNGYFEFMAALQDTYFISSQSAIPYSNSAGGNVVGYSRVDEINVGADESTNGKHIQYYKNNPDQTKINCPNIPDLSNGLLIGEDFINATGEILRSVSNLYTDINSLINPQGNSYTGVKVSNNFIGPDPCYRFTYPVNGVLNYDSRVLPTKYEIDFYPINSAWNVISNKSIRDFSGNSSIDITVAYTYNKLGQLINESTVNSQGETLVTSNLYPDDTPHGTSSTVQALIDSSFYDNILEQRHLNNDVEVSKSKISYAIVNNQLVQTENDKSYSSNPSFVDATFDRYGPNKTIRQITQKGSPVVLLWSYHHTYPIAEIKNTTYDAVEAALGGASAVNNFGSETPNKSRIEGFLATLSSALPNAQITTYTYDPLIGVTSITDPKGMTAYYEYDALQRLINIKDSHGDIVKHFDYHYQGQ